MKKTLDFFSRHLTLIFILTLFLLPIFSILMTSVSTRVEATGNVLIPSEPIFGNFTAIWNEYPMWRWILNTILVATMSAIGGLLSSLPAAYALSHFEWRGNKFVILATALAFIIPVQVTTISLYKIYSNLGWIPSFKALIVPFFLADPISVFILRQFLIRIPRNFSDVARLDGVSEFRIFVSIIFPLIKPALFATGVLIFLGSWNDLYQPLLYTVENQNLWTLSLGLLEVQGIHNTDPNLTMAASAIFVVPVIVMFLLVQSRIIGKLEIDSRTSQVSQ